MSKHNKYPQQQNRMTQQPVNRSATTLPPPKSARPLDAVELAKVAAQVPAGDALPGEAPGATFIEEVREGVKQERQATAERIQTAQEANSGVGPTVPLPPLGSDVGDPEAASLNRGAARGTLPQPVDAPLPRVWRVQATRTVRVNGNQCTYKAGRDLSEKTYSVAQLNQMREQGLQLIEIKEG